MDGVRPLTCFITRFLRGPGVWTGFTTPKPDTSMERPLRLCGRSVTSGVTTVRQTSIDGGHHAAVDAQVRARDVARAFADEEGDRVGNVRG